MAIRSTDSIDGLAFSGEAATAFSATPSEIECEVIDLFDQFRNSLLRYALSFGLSVHDGEEVTQEVFLALFQHLRVGKSRHNLRAWIFRVAHNLALKQRQANQRLSGGRDSHEARAEKQPDLAPSPEEQVLSRQRQQHLMAVLQALPERDRCCLGLRLEGLRYREIAPVLGMSLGAVSISLTRSLARLMRANER
jgi:RNA polymerase sigma-70 factor (ECF subfamily)